MLTLAVTNFTCEMLGQLITNEGRLVTFVAQSVWQLIRTVSYYDESHSVKCSFVMRM